MSSIRALFRVDSIDISSQLPFFNQAFHQRILILGWPDPEKAKYLKQWLNKHKADFSKQIAALVKQNVSGTYIQKLADDLINQLFDVLINMSDNDLFMHFAISIYDYSEQNKHTACRSRIIEYFTEAKRLVLQMQPYKPELLKLSTQHWSQVFTYCFRYRSPLEKRIDDFRAVARDAIDCLRLYIIYDAYMSEETPSSGLLRMGMSYAFSATLDKLLSRIDGFINLTAQSYNFWFKQDYMPAVTPDAELFQQGLYQVIMQHLKDQKKPEVQYGPCPYKALLDVLSLQSQKAELKESCYTKSSTAIIEEKTQLKPDVQSVSPEAKAASSTYKDFVIPGNHPAHLIQLKNGSYAKFIFDDVLEMLPYKKGQERMDITREFIRCLRDEREIKPPSRDECNSKKSPYHDATGKFKLHGMFKAHRLAFVTVSSSEEEQKLTGAATIQVPREHVQHSRRGYK